MMGEQQRTESLFYYFRLEDQIPNDHLLRLIDRHIDFSFVRERRCHRSREVCQSHSGRVARAPDKSQA